MKTKKFQRKTKNRLNFLENEILKFIIKDFTAKGRMPTMAEIMKAMRLPYINMVYQIVKELEKAGILSLDGLKIESVKKVSQRTHSEPRNTVAKDLMYKNPRIMSRE